MANSSGKRVCIIGAGIAGLSAAKVLHEDGFEVLAFEKDTHIGGVWSPSRAYPGLRANNPRETYAFSDHPYPAADDDFPTAAQVRAYLGSYVTRFGLQPLIRLGTEVLEVRRVPQGFAVTVRLVDGSVPPQTLPFDLIAVCNGVFSMPHVPEVQGRSDFAGRVCHSSELAQVEIGAGARVVVVGGAKSALDCAAATVQSGAATRLVFRRPHWMVPRFFFGRVRVDRMMFTRLSEAFLRYHRQGRGEAWLHGPGRLLVRLWWHQSNGLIRRQVRMPAAFRPDEPLPSNLGNVGIGGEFYGLLRAGKLCATRAAITRFDQNGVQLDNGEHIDADIVIFATGWRQGVPFLEPPLLDAVQRDGRFRLYRHILPPREPRLGFVGYASSAACQLTAEVGAHWLSQCFRGEIALPGVEHMEAEVAHVARWAAEFGPARNSGYFIGPFMAHYIDELLCDMGLPTRRKRNVFAEYLAPLWPERYAALTEERRRQRRSRGAG